MTSYKEVHKAYEKLQNGEELTESERDELVNVVGNAMGKWIPTKEEMVEYNANVEDVKRYGQSIKTTDLIPPILEKMEDYNDKYHQGE
jgi:hypothetical protein